MSALQGIRGQKYRDQFFDASGTITQGATAQLVLPVVESRSSLIIQNISAVAMYVEIGPARAYCALTSGVVTSVTVSNAGMGYSRAPTVKFVGGLLYNGAASPTYTLSGTPDMMSPGSVAKAHCVMTGSAPNMTIASIAIDSGGSGYAYPPYVLLENDRLDPFGSAVPSTTSGIYLAASGGSYTSNGSVCTTDQIAIYCATTSSAFTCKYTF